MLETQQSVLDEDNYNKAVEHRKNALSIGKKV